ncbi:tetratricopeptide repeat protein 34 [Phascolarctos cinereus]|uniref:Tetratricopeptide repeat protein 34 n=1 Tax=Phascolarctos cinereus TaxID=38626 RepID=A0A6P5JB03_PHACI|nr:tetratricopeptide repeat protein 34 [Phascolarctos cinereus]XP_020831319.1 tetratricopeptide repeat protein 34 [Phascolarctos cinereus]
MSAQELTVHLWQEGDRHLTLDELPLATAFYLAAFSCHPSSVVQRAQQSLSQEQTGQVVSILEAWCRGEAQIPSIHWDGMAVVSLTVALAAAFLSALHPNNLAASLYRLTTLMGQGRHEEVASRCNALLEVHVPGSLELRLVRALAWIMSGAKVGDGVIEYLQAFVTYANQTLGFILSHQRDHLPLLIRACQDYLLEQHKAEAAGSQWASDCHCFLAALAPRETQGSSTQAASLLRTGRWEECVTMCSRMLESTPTDGKLQGECASILLVIRAAASFCLRCRSREMLQDLQEAFRLNPDRAKRQLEEVFSPRDMDQILAQAQEILERDFSLFREAVRARVELRADGGTELLPPIVHTLRFLLCVAPLGAQRELTIRLIDCLLLSGDSHSALGLCDRLLGSKHPTYLSTLLTLRGFCTLRAGKAGQALEDFQAVVEHEAPHPGSCVRALCGRGLLRLLAGSPYLATLDYITASRLRLQEAVFTVKSYIPWNQRGLLLKVLQEEGQKMLQRRAEPASGGTSTCCKKATEEEGTLPAKEGDACGVHQLAALLMELDASDEISRLLSADALYQMGRIEDAHKTLLVALSKSPHTAPILARLALLQLRKGFFYDANLLIKKVIQIGDTSCLQLIMEIFREEDRKLLQNHCHSRAVTILKNKQGDTYTKEAIAYLSLAIIASGSQARESLLARARCYGHLGQKKTAIYDFNTILRTDPTNVQALCGRAFMHLVLNQQKEAVDNIVSALTLDMAGVVPEILSLKQEAQVFITQGLYSHCRAGLNQLASDRSLPREETFEKLLAIGEALVKIDATNSSWRILLADVLILTGHYEKALEHLQEVLGPTPRSEPAQARLGFLQLKKRDTEAAIHNLQPLAGKDPKDLGFLLYLLDAKLRHSLSQAAAEEGNVLEKDQCPEKALGYYTLAVLASNGNPSYLRMRASCLSHLQDFSQALRDLDKVIQKHTANDLQTQVEDFCSRGRLFLGLLDEASAVEEFIRAFQLSPSLALHSVSAQPGPKPLAQMFHLAGQHCLEEQRYEDSWKVVQYGLLLDENSSDLKKLRGRIKREVSWGCSIH